MPEYIEREALLEKAKELQGGSFSTPLIISAIEKAPAADVVEVKHGEWIILGDCDFQCPECGFRFTSPDDISMFKFCRCGLKMDLNNNI